MLDCHYTEPSQKGRSDAQLSVSDIPETYFWKISSLADDCGCNVKERTKTSIRVYGKIENLTLFEQEILGIFARLTYLENCLSKS